MLTLMVFSLPLPLHHLPTSGNSFVIFVVAVILVIFSIAPCFSSSSSSSSPSHSFTSASTLVPTTSTFVNYNHNDSYNVAILMVGRSQTNRFDLVHIGP